MPDPFTFTVIVALLAKNAPSWLDALRGTLFDKGKEIAIEKGAGLIHGFLHLDEKEQQRHLELALKNAAERGLARFSIPQERDQYRAILEFLSQPGPNNEALCHEALSLFTLSDLPDFTALSENYNLRQRISALAKHGQHEEVDVTPYLSSFFNALIAELYADPYFRQQMSNVLKIRTAQNMQRSLIEVVTTLRQIGDALTDRYTLEQFEQDVAAYTAHIERTTRYLKLVGVVPKDRGEKSPDPELHSIFVPLRITLQGQTISKEEEQDSIIALLEDSHHIILLGGPGSGKSTVTRYLAWSHAAANLANSSMMVSNIPLLAGNPLPLRIELRRLTQDRRQHPEYNFLSYMTEVVLGREGIEINAQMFKELLERRSMLLLFDGLDEVATLEERKQLLEEIEHFALHYPGNHILVTSRPVGYELASFSHQWFTQAHVQEFNDEQIRQFLKHWYTHVLRLFPIPHDDQKELEDLFKALRENPRLHRLAENPLLLTVITSLHRYERLPDRRVLIYDRCADLLLETWAKLKGTDAQWKDLRMIKEDQYACVAHLGFVLHERSQEKESNKKGGKEDSASDVPTRFMLKEIERFLNSRKLIGEVAERRTEAKRFLELVQIEAGLIVERGKDENGEDLYGFVHRTFQEYFAAADVYERYQQEEDPTIISEFLIEHLHDPHWHEVILLLLGKLKRKPATAQLGQILEGKIKSRRSQYTDIVQQDLFFVCDCLIEEIAVESDLAEGIFSRLSNLAKNSPFLLQRKEALKALSKLILTRQYASLARGSLVTLLTQNSITDIRTKIALAQTLLQNSPEASEEQRLATRTLLRLAQQTDLSAEYAMEAARVLHESRSKGENESVAFQLLLQIAQHPDLPVEQAIHIADQLCWSYSQIPERRKAPLQLLLQIAQHPDLTVEQTVRAAWALFAHSPHSSKEEQLSLQLLLQLAQRPTLSINQVIQAAEVLESLYWSHPVPGAENLASQLLLQFAQCSTLSFEERVQIVDAFHRCSRPSSEKGQEAFQMLLDLVHHPDLSFEQIMRVANTLYRCSSSAEQRERAIQMLLDLVHYPDLSFEQVVQVADSLYTKSYKRPDLEQEASWLLLDLAQRSALSFEQTVQVMEVLYRCSPSSTKIRKRATRTLMHLAQRTNLPIEQAICIAQALFQSSPEDSEEQRQAIQMLLGQVQRIDLPVEQIIQATQALYQNSHPKSVNRRQVANILWQLAQNQYISAYQQLQIATVALMVKRANYIDRLESVKTVLSLLSRDDAGHYLEKHWGSMNLITQGPSGTLSRDISNEPEPIDIPYIAELAGQEMLPTEAREEMYQLLDDMVPQFDKIPMLDSQSTP